MGMQVRSSGYTGHRFDSFDPDINSFDPSIARTVNNATGTTGTSPSAVSAAKPGQKMQINLTITNATAAQMTAELFQWLDSVTFRLKPELVVGNYLMIPESSHEGLRRVVANTGGVVGWDQNGNLCYRGNDATPDPLFTVGCSEVSYRSLFQASSILPFNISFIRENVSANAQIDNKITWFRKTIGGGFVQNVVSPRAYFRPNQFQSLTIDIPVALSIQVDAGIQIPVIAGGTVTLALFIDFWTYQDIGS
jgi:hypothetical protein